MCNYQPCIRYIGRGRYGTICDLRRNPLVGEVEIGGAKNAALPILAASVMTDETVLIENMPDVRDTNILLKAMAGIGAHVERVDRHTVKINGSLIHDLTVNGDSVKKIRASYYFLGALLGKYKKSDGCASGRLRHRLRAS